MGDRIFFDTNIICYAFDLAEPAKRKVCERLLYKVFTGEISGVVSNQVLGEVFSASVTKMRMPADKVAVVVKALILSEKWEKIDYTTRTVDRALDGYGSAGSHFWDLLIAETMKENGVARIITENEKDFGGIPGIRVTNPFRSRT